VGGGSTNLAFGDQRFGAVGGELSLRSPVYERLGPLRHHHHRRRQRPDHRRRLTEVGTLMTYLRRKFLKVGLMGAAAIALPLVTLSIPLTRLAASAAARSPSVEPFEVPLPIPQILKPMRTSSDTAYYEAVQRMGRQEILPGLMAEVWG
jgi:hypothetical protein